MAHESFASTSEYEAALRSLIAEGVSEGELALLRAHALAPLWVRSARALADEVGDRDHAAVSLRYASLARRFAGKLGVTAPPQGLWLCVLVDWVGASAPTAGTQLVLRREVVGALRALGVVPTERR